MENYIWFVENYLKQKYKAIDMQYIIYMEKNEEISVTTDSAIQKKKGSKEI